MQLSLNGYSSESSMIGENSDMFISSKHFYSLEGHSNYNGKGGRGAIKVKGGYEIGVLRNMGMQFLVALR